MKKFYIIGLLTLTSCLGFKELPVDYDYSYKGNFRKYRTFDMMKSLNLKDSSMINESIEKSIASRMKFLGYKKTNTRPHLIISYKMYFDSLKFNGYDQPDIEAWSKNRKEDLNYDKHRYNMKSGTLLIQFYDRRQNRSIWQGYATTLYGNIDYGNQKHLRNAVISILDKYRFWADGFLDQQQAANQDEVENP
jgi:hypothetical protein